jgi:hypothetical protein
VPSTTAMRRCAEGLSAQTPHGLPPTLRDGLWTYSLPPCDPTSTDVATGSPPRGLQTTFATDPFWYTSEVDLLYPPPKVPIVRRAKCPSSKGRDWEVHEVPVIHQLPRALPDSCPRGGLAKDGPHPAVQLGALPPGRSIVILAGRATRVP